ncbi:MAG TPA: acyltransferase [Solirubrobacteraceae bacterium]|nr:acyltransferase [Solirubrobacteraceae bacterium]
MRLDDLTGNDRHRNNFDLLRLLAAALVVFGHSFDLLGAHEPFPDLGPNMNWGFVGVLIFFSISGFLVSQSWTRTPSLAAFAAKRAVRLMPALLVALVLSAFVLGPLVTSLSAHAYLSSAATKAYVFENATMQTNYFLPGVFAHNAYPDAVNGSLWTLPLEIKAYVLVAALGALGLLGRFRRALIPVAVLLVLICVDDLRSLIPGANSFVAGLVNIQAPAELVTKADAGVCDVFAELFAAFAIGAALFALRRRVVLRWELAAVAGAAWLCTVAIGGQAPELGAVVLAPYVVLWLAYATRGHVRLPKWMGDYSYGAYVYGFPVQQTISLLMYPLGGWLMFAVAGPITALLAVLSWHLIERPALRMKERLGRAATLASAPAGLVAVHDGAP